MYHKIWKSTFMVFLSFLKLDKHGHNELYGKNLHKDFSKFFENKDRIFLFFEKLTY